MKVNLQHTPGASELRESTNCSMARRNKLTSVLRIICNCRKGCVASALSKKIHGNMASSHVCKAWPCSKILKASFLSLHATAFRLAHLPTHSIPSIHSISEVQGSRFKFHRSSQGGECRGLGASRWKHIISIPISTIPCAHSLT